MRRTVVALVPLFLSAMALSAFAQGKVDTDPKMTEDVKVTISGGADLDWVWRDRALGASRGDYGSYGAGLGDTSRSEGVIHGHYWLKVDADLSEKVRITLTLENNRYDVPAPSTAPSNDLLGTNPEGLPIIVHDLEIHLNELIDPAIGAIFGTHGVTFSPRGTNRSLFLSPDSSSDLLHNGSVISEFGPTGFNQANGTPDTIRPAGGVVSYTKETYVIHLMLLPGTVEGGSAKNDQANYGLDAWYLFAER